MKNKHEFWENIWTRNVTTLLSGSNVQFDGKLYLEPVVKMLEDFHAARVSWIRTNQRRSSCSQELRDQVRVIAISTNNIEHSAPWGPRSFLMVSTVWSANSVDVAGCQSSPNSWTSCSSTRKQLDKSGINSYLPLSTSRSYQTDMDHIISPEDGEKMTTSKLAAIWSLWALLDLVLVSWQRVCVYDPSKWDQNQVAAKFLCTTQLTRLINATADLDDVNRSLPKPTVKQRSTQPRVEIFTMRAHVGTA